MVSDLSLVDSRLAVLYERLCVSLVMPYMFWLSKEGNNFRFVFTALVQYIVNGLESVIRLGAAELRAQVTKNNSKPLSNTLALEIAMQFRLNC